jgi:hypothetical protein
VAGIGERRILKDGPLAAPFMIEGEIKSTGVVDEADEGFTGVLRGGVPRNNFCLIEQKTVRAIKNDLFHIARAIVEMKSEREESVV